MNHAIHIQLSVDRGELQSGAIIPCILFLSSMALSNICIGPHISREVQIFLGLGGTKKVDKKLSAVAVATLCKLRYCHESGMNKMLMAT